jgi:putative toxin-antitoxin system antitoxin component (TIGR02293 family)
MQRRGNPGIADQVFRSGSLVDPTRDRVLETHKSLVSAWMKAVICAPLGWRVLWLKTMSHLAQGEFMESAFVLAEKPPLEILSQVRNGLPAAMFEQVALTLGFSASTLAAKLGIARRTVTRKRGNGAPLSSETSEKLLRVARVRNLGRTIFTTDEAVSEWLSKPDATLINMAPLDLLDTDLGAREVENLLRALAYGHFV